MLIAALAVITIVPALVITPPPHVLTLTALQHRRCASRRPPSRVRSRAQAGAGQQCTGVVSLLRREFCLSQSHALNQRAGRRWLSSS
jgi:hypothetical protein